MVHEFSSLAYQDLLQGFGVRGYAIVGYDQVDPSKKHIILRHDIDMSIESALRMANIEASLKVSAHYFVLLRSELYNPYTKDNLKSLESISSLGHKIGLHLDASLYRSDWRALEIAADQECKILENIIQKEVNLVSFHRPNKDLLGNGQNIAGRMHTYQPRFFKEIGYCSDSRGAWKYGHPYDHDAFKQGKALQLLTHPIWWDGGSISAINRLTELVETKNLQFQNSLGENCETYQERHSMKTISKKY